MSQNIGDNHNKSTREKKRMVRGEKLFLTRVMESSVVALDLLQNKIGYVVRYHAHQSSVSVGLLLYDQMPNENKQNITVFGKETC